MCDSFHSKNTHLYQEGAPVMCAHTTLTAHTFHRKPQILQHLPLCQVRLWACEGETRQEMWQKGERGGKKIIIKKKYIKKK